MNEARQVYAAEPPRAGSGVKLLIGILAVLVIFLLMVTFFDPDRDGSYVLLYIGFVGASLLYLLYRLIRPKRLSVQYVLDAQELRIETEKRVMRVPYAEIEQVAVQTFERNLLMVHGQMENGHARGTLRWHGKALEAIATRRDRLVLLDTRQGLLGVSPAAEQEEAFLTELAARTGRDVGYESLHPRHAEHLPALWPVFAGAFGLFLTMENLLSLFYPERDMWREGIRLAMVVSLSLSFQLLYPLHRRVPWLLYTLAVPLVVCAFWVMSW